MVKLGITGVPGTGKTEVARELAIRLGYDLIEVNKYAKQFGVGFYKDSLEVDIDKLEEFLNKILYEKENVVIEGHLVCNMKLNLDFVFVLRCYPGELEARLKSRGWDYEKIKENVESEILDYCLLLSEDNYEDVYQVDTTGKSVEEVVDKILGILEGKESQDFVDWSEYLFNSL